MGKIIEFQHPDRGVPPNQVLEQAVDKYENLVIIGNDFEGVLDVRASSNMTHSDVLWLIEMFKQKLLNGDYNDG